MSVMPDKELFCNVDGALMWRVIDNLLSNICKYAQSGTRVYLTLEKTGGEAVVTFKNTSRAALNIPAEELMERFVRGDGSRSTEGNGLGLSIAQSLTGWSINQSSYSPRFDPNQVRSMIHSGTLGGYGFSDAEVDEYLEAIGRGGTNEERLAIWEKLQARIWETLPFLKFGDSLSLSAIRADIQGYTPSYVDRFWMVHE